MPRAVWNGHVIAESDKTRIVEGNHYFPPDSIRSEYFEDSDTTTRCFWKGKACYKDVVVDGSVNPNAAWYYPEPSRAARKIAGWYAFWHGIRVEA